MTILTKSYSVWKQDFAAIHPCLKQLASNLCVNLHSAAIILPCCGTIRTKIPANVNAVWIADLLFYFLDLAAMIYFNRAFSSIRVIPAFHAMPGTMICQSLELISSGKR